MNIVFNDIASQDKASPRNKNLTYLLVIEVSAKRGLQALSNLLSSHGLQVGGGEDTVDDAGKLALLFNCDCGKLEGWDPLLS